MNCYDNGVRISARFRSSARQQNMSLKIAMTACEAGSFIGKGGYKLKLIQEQLGAGVVWSFGKRSLPIDNLTSARAALIRASTPAKLSCAVDAVMCCLLDMSERTATVPIFRIILPHLPRNSDKQAASAFLTYANRSLLPRLGLQHELLLSPAFFSEPSTVGSFVVEISPSRIVASGEAAALLASGYYGDVNSVIQPSTFLEMIRAFILALVEESQGLRYTGWEVEHRALRSQPVFQTASSPPAAAAASAAHGGHQPKSYRTAFGLLQSTAEQKRRAEHAAQRMMSEGQHSRPAAPRGLQASSMAPSTIAPGSLVQYTAHAAYTRGQSSSTRPISTTAHSQSMQIAAAHQMYAQYHQYYERARQHQQHHLAVDPSQAQLYAAAQAAAVVPPPHMARSCVQQTGPTQPGRVAASMQLPATFPMRMDFSPHKDDPTVAEQAKTMKADAATCTKDPDVLVICMQFHVLVHCNLVTTSAYSQELGRICTECSVHVIVSCGEKDQPNCNMNASAVAPEEGTDLGETDHEEQNHESDQEQVKSYSEQGDSCSSLSGQKHLTTADSCNIYVVGSEADVSAACQRIRVLCKAIVSRQKDKSPASWASSSSQKTVGSWDRHSPSGSPKTTACDPLANQLLVSDRVLTLRGKVEGPPHTREKGFGRKRTMSV